MTFNMTLTKAGHGSAVAGRWDENFEWKFKLTNDGA